MKKSKRRGSLFITFLLFIAGLAVVIFLSPLLLLSEIHVTELSHYTENDIINVSGIEKGQNAVKYLGGSLKHLLQFRMGKAENHVQNLPRVKSAQILYQFPHTVVMTIEERQAIAWVKRMGNYLLVDEEGYVMEVSTELDDKYPEIRGFQLDKFEIGKKVETENLERMEWLVRLLQSLNQVDQNTTQKLVEVIDWIDFSVKEELYLSLDGRITAKMKLDNELTYRLSYLKEIYYNHIKKEEKGMVDFFDDKYARFIAE